MTSKKIFESNLYLHKENTEIEICTSKFKRNYKGQMDKCKINILKK